MNNKKPIQRYEKLRKQRRIMRCLVDLNTVGEMFLPTKFNLQIEGLPKDAVFLGASNAPEYYAFSFFYAHESFESVPAGGQVPVLQVTITRKEK